MTGHFGQNSGLVKLWFFVLQHCRIKTILTNSIFLLFLEINKEIFCLFQDFQGPRPKFKNFPGPGNFFLQFQDFPGFSRTVATLTIKMLLNTISNRWAFILDNSHHFQNRKREEDDCIKDIYNKNPHIRTGVWGIQSDAVLIYRVITAKSTWNCS